MLEKLRRIAENIKRVEGERKELAGRIRYNSGKVVFPEALEKELVIPVNNVEVDGSVVGVDGGLLAQEFHGIDLLLTRAVAVLFEYEKTNKKSHAYYPSAFPPIEVDVLTSLESHEISWHKSLFRMRKEIGTAIEAVEKFRPGYLLLDGSVVPSIGDKPSEESSVRPLYIEVIGKYKQLYSVCDKAGCAIVGVIKDSRGKRFIEIIGKHAGESGAIHKSTDTTFLHFLLKEGERTAAFRYASSPERHQVLRDLGECAGRINAFYLKPVKDDRPLRVEFLSNKYDEIASFINSLSRIHKRYGYPAILIEADLRAALERNEIERVSRELFMLLGERSSIMKLRRNSRPFR